MAGRTDLEQIVYQMSTDIRALERQNKRAIANVDGTANRIEARYKQVGKVDVGKFFDQTFDRTRLAAFELGAARVPIFGQALEALGPAGFAAAAGIGAVALATTQALGAMRFADEIDDAAAKLNIGTEALQEYRFALTEVGGEAKDADSAIEGFQKKLGEGIAGGRSVKWFERLGFSAADLKAFDSTEDALDDVLDRISALGSEAERAAVAEKLGLGPMIALAREGGDRLDELRQRARDLGIVMDAELISRAAAANQEFESLARVVDIQLKSAFVDLAPALVTAIGLIAELATELARAMDQWRALDAKTATGLRAERATLTAERDAIAAQFGTRPLNGQVVVGRKIEGANYSMVDPGAVRRSAGPNPFAPRTPRLPTAQPGRFGLWQDRGNASYLDAGEQFDAAARRIEKIDAELAERNARQPQGNRPGTGLIDTSTSGGGSRGGARRSSGPSPEELAKRRAEMERGLAIEIARLSNNERLVQTLEREAAIARRVEQYAAAGLSAAEAKRQASADQALIDEARRDGQDKELRTLQTQHDIEVERMLGNERFASTMQDRLDLEQAIERLIASGFDTITATNLAEMNLLEIQRARAEVMARIVADAAAERQLSLARLAGDEERVRVLERAREIQARARDIEGREGLNSGEGLIRATSEVDEEIAAASRRGFRDGVRGLLDDLQDGGLEGVLSTIFDRVSDRLKDNLADMLTDYLFQAMGRGSSGGGFDLGGSIASVLGSFGRRERGGPVRGGRPYIVGEKRPEVFVPGVSGTILPSLSAMGGSGGVRRGGGSSIAFNMTVDLKGANGDQTIRAIAEDAARRGATEAYERAKAEIPAQMAYSRKYSRP